MIRTVNLETAKLLKEEGFRQDTEKWWINIPKGISSSTSYQDGWRFCNSGGDKVNIEKYAAPTPDELLDELPSKLRLKDDDYYMWVTHIKDRTWEIRYSDSMHAWHKGIEQNDILCEALAQMWLWLKKEGLI